MKDWKAIAAAMGARITEPERVLPVLDALEKNFRPLVARIPHDTEPCLAFRPYQESENRK